MEQAGTVLYHYRPNYLAEIFQYKFHILRARFHVFYKTYQIILVQNQVIRLR